MPKIFCYADFDATTAIILGEVRWMRRCGSVNVIVYAPNTETGHKELARRVASIHADAVIAQLQKFSCPTAQKQQLLDSIIAERTHLHKT